MWSARRLRNNPRLTDGPLAARVGIGHPVKDVLPVPVTLPDFTSPLGYDVIAWRRTLSSRPGSGVPVSGYTRPAADPGPHGATDPAGATAQRTRRRHRRGRAGRARRDVGSGARARTRRSAPPIPRAVENLSDRVADPAVLGSFTGIDICRGWRRQCPPFPSAAPRLQNGCARRAACITDDDVDASRARPRRRAGIPGATRVGRDRSRPDARTPAVRETGDLAVRTRRARRVRPATAVPCRVKGRPARLTHGGRR
jgi:hypothetical protein